MKKLLTLFLTSTFLFSSATQLVSCEKQAINVYKNPVDIQKFWDYKGNNLISVNSLNSSKTNSDNKFEANLEQLKKDILKNIGFNFIDLTEQKLEELDIKFFFYHAKPLAELDISELNNVWPPMEEEIFKKEILDQIVNDKTIQIKSFYFRYQINDWQSTKFLKINLTNVPILKENIFKNNALLKAKIKDQEYIEFKLSAYFLRNILEKHKKNPNSTITIEEKDLRELSKAIVLILENYLKLNFVNDIEFIENFNPHTNIKYPYLFKKINSYMNIKPLIPLEMIYEIIKSSVSEANWLKKWLGIDETTKIIFKLIES